MNARLNVSILCLVLAAAAYQVAAQGTAFDYQGRLISQGNAANGSYDFTFSLYDANTAGDLIAGPLETDGLDVTNGLFTVPLDFGPGVFAGSNLWLEIAVRLSGDPEFETLSPRQQILPTPYAMFAKQAGGMPDGSLTASQLQVVGAAPTAGEVLGYDGTNFVWSDTFIGDGSGLLNVNAAALDGLAAGDFWQLGGNAGTTPGINFVGTTDNEPLEFWVNGQRALRLEPNVSVGAPNVIGGSPTNHVDGGTLGAFIGGGGATSYLGGHYVNHVSANWGSIVGGGGNTIQHSAIFAAIGGGQGNTIYTNGSDSVIGGGFDNGIGLGSSGLAGATAAYSVIGGGFANQISSDESAISGGLENIIQVGADGSFIAGGSYCTIGTNAQSSFAAGYFAAAMTSGSFVWADSSSDNAFASTAPNQFVIRATGGVGIGTGSPVAALDVRGSLNVTGPLTVGDNFIATIGCGDFKIGYSSRRGSPGRALSDEGTFLGLNCCGDWATTYVGGGNVSVCTLTVRGGCDISEPFPTAGGQMEKGTVLIIDEEHPGQLKISERAYDTRVAGIASGANGINPGISLRQEGAMDAGQDVALSGRVYVQADAAFGAIKPGDLLTTSDTPGYAMKVTDHSKAQGAILGKAMSGLNTGKGIVLVLVSLQ